jgi:hypothetical protein
MKTTIVRKNSGIWDSTEIAEISLTIETEVSFHIKYPDFMIILGHKSKEELEKHIKTPFSFKRDSASFSNFSILASLSCLDPAYISAYSGVDLRYSLTLYNFPSSTIVFLK